MIKSTFDAEDFMFPLKSLLLLPTLEVLQLVEPLQAIHRDVLGLLLLRNQGRLEGAFLSLLPLPGLQVPLLRLSFARLHLFDLMHLRWHERRGPQSSLSHELRLEGILRQLV